METQIEITELISAPELLPVLDAVAQVMDEAEYKYMRNESSIRSRFPTGQSFVELTARKGREYLSSMMLTFNICCPVEQRNQLLIFMNEINWGTIVSSMEMDPNDGEVRGRVGILLDKGRCTKEQADTAINILLGMGRDYAKYILKIAYQNVSSEAALEELRAKEEQ